MLLPVYKSQVNVTHAATQVRGEASGGAAAGVAKAAGQVMAAAEDWGRQAQREAALQEDRAAKVEASRVVAETRLDWTTRYVKAQETAPEDGKDFTPSLLTDFDGDAKQRLAAASEQARPYLETHFADLRTSLAEKALTFEAGSRLAKQTRDLSSTIDLNANLVRTDFSQLASAVKLAEGAIDASSLAADAKTKARDHARETIAVSALQGLNEKDPAQARTLLEKGVFDGFLSPNAKNALVNNNIVELHRRQQEAEQRQRMAEMDARARKAELHEEVKFAQSALRDGVAYAGLGDLIKRAKAIDPKTAAALELSQRDLGWTQNLNKMPPGEIAAEIERTKKAAESVDNPLLAATLSNRLAKGQHVLDNVIQNLKADPLGWAEKQGVVKPTAIEPNNPDSIKARLGAVQAAKAWYGRTDIGLLRPQEVEGIVTRFNEVQSPGDKLKLLQAVTTGLGDDKAARQVLGQLVDQGKLPERAVYALEIAKDPFNQGTAKKVLSELTAPDTMVQLTDGDLNTAKKQVVNALSGGVGGVLLKAKEITGDDSYRLMADRHASALLHITKVRTAGGQDDPAGSAYQDMFGHLQVLDVDDFAHVTAPKGTDMDVVERGLTVLRAQASKLLEPLTPADNPEAARRVGAYADDILRRGTWVNDGDGFALVVPGAGGLKVGEKEKVRRWSLDEVLDAGRKYNSGPSLDAAMPLGG